MTVINTIVYEVHGYVAEHFQSSNIITSLYVI